MTAEGKHHYRCGSQVDLKTGATSKCGSTLQAIAVSAAIIAKEFADPRTFSAPVAVPVGNGVALRVAESNGDVYETPMIRVQAVREK
jgi:hypothetical protein